MIFLVIRAYHSFGLSQKNGFDRFSIDDSTEQSLYFHWGVIVIIIIILILPSLVSFEAPKYTPDSGNRHRIRHAFQRVKILHDSKIPRNDHRKYLFWYFNDNCLLRVLVIVPEPNCYCCFPYWALGKIFASGFRVWCIKLLKKRRRCELYLPNNHPFSLFWHFNDTDFLPASVTECLYSD